MPAAKPLVQAGKTRLVGLQDLDRRSRAYQTAVNVKANIIADLGGETELSTLETLLAGHAALAAAVVEDSHVRWLAGDPVELQELSLVQNAFMRIAQALGLRRRQRDITQDLSSYLQGQNGAVEPSCGSSEAYKQGTDNNGEDEK